MSPSCTFIVNSMTSNLPSIIDLSFHILLGLLFIEGKICTLETLTDIEQLQY